MKNKHKYRLSFILMVSGLLLLLILEGLWLDEVYKDNVYSLRRENNRTFFGAVRDIQDSLRAQFYESPIVFQFKDSMQVATVNITRYPRLDSAKLLLMHGNEIQTQLNSKAPFESEELVDTVISLGYQRRRNNERQRGEMGALALYIALTDPELVADSNWSEKTTPILDNIFEERLNLAYRDANFPLKHQIIKVEDSLWVRSGIETFPYIDYPSGNKYIVKIPEFRPFIFRKILPEILFSFLLLVSLSLAFVLIVQYLIRQNRLSRMKDDFISNVTHELKTPITTVGVAIEALSSFHGLNDPARTQEYLEISKHELNRLTILVDRVLKMAQFETDEPDMKMESLDFKDLIQGILNSMKLQFDKLAAKVSFESVGDRFEISGDKIHLTSVVYNLVDNALKYSEHQPQISIDLASNGKEMTFSVADKGMGIAQEYIDKIFDKFFRVPNGNTHNIKGYGLGLSYVASVIERHEGRIEVNSAPGKGTRFTVYLPKHPNGSN